MDFLVPERRVRRARHLQTNVGSLIAALYDAADEMTRDRSERDTLVAAALLDLVQERREVEVDQAA